MNTFLRISANIWGLADEEDHIDGSIVAAPGAAGSSIIGAAAARLHRGQVGIEDFELLRVLGKGSFGKVFMVRMVATKRVYAMKVLKKQDIIRRQQVEHTRAERRILGEIEHPFIVSLRFAFQTPTKLYLVTDYCAGGELFHHLKIARGFEERVVRFVMAELVVAVQHLHSQGIVYRDLKVCARLQQLPHGRPWLGWP